jgi:hypothetical protein
MSNHLREQWKSAAKRQWSQQWSAGVKVFRGVAVNARLDIQNDYGEQWWRLNYPNKTAVLQTTYEEPGRVGERTHITREDRGTIPTERIANMPGVMGEVPGEHRNKHGEKWEAFKADIAANGITNPIFITVDYGEEPKISEGNHRRDAAVELGLLEVPATVRYFGHAEQLGVLASLYPQPWEAAWVPTSTVMGWIDPNLRPGFERGLEDGYNANLAEILQREGLKYPLQVFTNLAQKGGQPGRPLLYDGNHRAWVLKKMGWDRMPVVLLEREVQRGLRWEDMVDGPLEVAPEYRPFYADELESYMRREGLA